MRCLNNEEYYYLLDKRFQKLKELREAAKTVAAGIIGNTLYKEDLFLSYLWAVGDKAHIF